MLDVDPREKQAAPGGLGVRPGAWWLPWLAAWGVFIGGEFLAPSKRSGRQAVVEWLFGSDDRLVYLLLLIAAPLVWWLSGSVRLQTMASLRGIGRKLDTLFANLAGPASDAIWRPIGFSILVAAVSLGFSLAVASRFDHLPPAYHDEYSYLFQAETFLAGRVSYPSHEAARLFDQMHVLNEGCFASRYFPGAGLWMAPFVAAAHPWWGHWLAGAICAVLMLWIGRELAGDVAGLIAGLLTALSPGMALFSNLLLAHHPTLVGLGIFLLAMLRMERSANVGWGALAGIGLAFAALCRPMTAAGVAVPVGLYLLWWAWNGPLRTPPLSKGGQWGSGDDVMLEPLAQDALETIHPTPQVARKARLLALVTLGMPLVASAIGLFFYNRAITGDGWKTPYSLYTEIYTPRHVYGFNNVERGERNLGPRVLENYDRWAENLTPSLATANSLTRLTASWKWTLGILPLTLALGGGLVLWRQLPRGAWLILAAIASLHAAHIPYWFVGMEDHHYVFESGALWAVWVGVVSVAAARAWRANGHSPMTWWWGLTLASAVVMNLTVSAARNPEGSLTELVWSAPLEQGIRRVLFARRKHGQFEALVARQALPHPALVLVEPDPADRHIDYVTNTPSLDAPTLIGRYLPDEVPVSRVKQLFPGRNLFLYRVRDGEWRRLN
jgi:hypothetical protein